MQTSRGLHGAFIGARDDRAARQVCRGPGVTPHFTPVITSVVERRARDKEPPR
jgi:hypothetical protein